MTIVTLSSTTVSVSNLANIELDLSLLKNANIELAKAIVEAIKKTDPDFLHLKRFNPHHWDLSDEGGQKTLFKAYSQAKALWDNWDVQEMGEKTKEMYESHLEELIGMELQAYGTNYDYECFWGDALAEEYPYLSQNIINSLIESAEENEVEYDSELASEEFEDTLRELITDAIADADDSTYEDILPSHGSLEINYTFGFNKKSQCIDDYFIRHNGNCSSTEAIEVDERLENFFTMANVSVQAFADYLQSKGYDEETVASYRALKDTHDSNLPPRVEHDAIIEVLDNATYGGIPMVTFFVNVADLIRKHPDEGISIDNGVIGIEDTINGSGHNTDLNIASNHLHIAPESLQYLHSPIGYARDEVYGFARSYLKANVM